MCSKPAVERGEAGSTIRVCGSTPGRRFSTSSTGAPLAQTGSLAQGRWPEPPARDPSLHCTLTSVAHSRAVFGQRIQQATGSTWGGCVCDPDTILRSEEHTSELQSLRHLVCRLLLEKKK